jgi:2-aminoadipate transaminase
VRESKADPCSPSLGFFGTHTRILIAIMSCSQTKPGSSRPAFAQWIRSSNNVTQEFLSFGGRSDMISLAGGLPAAELYPIREIQAAVETALAKHGTAALEYGTVEGLPALRALIAQRLSVETGGLFASSNVLLTTGAMQGLDLIGKVLIDEGDTIVAQSPTYLGALDAWRPRKPVYQPLDWNGENADAIGSLRTCKFVYTVPNYSNPTGVLVSQASRGALLKNVLESGTWLVEDDPYRCLQLNGPPGPSILGHYVAQRPELYDGPIIYLGTVSKSLVPGLRVGWIVAGEGMIQALALAKQSSDLSSSMFTQAVACELMEAGFDAVHSEKIVPVYRERRDALCREAALRIGRWFEWEIPEGGMFVWMRAKGNAIDTNALYRLAVEEKVAFVPSSVFEFTGKDRFGMRLNFTRNPPDLIREGIERLERAIHKYVEQVR